MFSSVLREVEGNEFLRGSTSTSFVGCVDLNFESFFYVHKLSNSAFYEASECYVLTQLFALLKMKSVIPDAKNKTHIICVLFSVQEYIF